jgi:hypothetical protein
MLWTYLKYPCITSAMGALDFLCWAVTQQMGNHDKGKESVIRKYDKEWDKSWDAQCKVMSRYS